MPSGLPSGAVSGPIAGHTPAPPLPSRHINNIHVVVNRSTNRVVRPAITVVTVSSPVGLRFEVSEMVSDAVPTDRRRGVNGKGEKDDTNRRKQRNAPGLAARIEADIRQHVHAELRRHLERWT
ncbi:putative xsa-associated protein (fragment) [Xanthomonas phaseoli pv. phaseoli]|uniref:Xsa-associated protein n=1 Tax=Xanthomonas campestris pv. phaseoli TaxID=317013 RepID=A0AB38DTU8_XANCH